MGPEETFVFCRFLWLVIALTTHTSHWKTVLAATTFFLNAAAND